MYTKEVNTCWKDMIIITSNKKESIEYTSPLNPSNNGYNSYRVITKGGRSFVQAYPSAEYVSYKNKFIPYLKNLVKEYEWQMIDEFKHYYLDLVIYFPKTSHDPTNYFKTLQDVANGLLWFDDKIVVGRIQRVYYTYNEECEPRVECKLYPVDYIGIWDTEEEYNQFIEICKGCRNYKEGQCKRLSEYMEYKITKDFDLKTRACLGFKEIKVVKEKKPKKIN